MLLPMRPWVQPGRKSLSAELRRNHRVSPNKSFSANLGCARRVSSASFGGKFSVFSESFFDKRLFAQIGALRAHFSLPLLLLEKSSTPSREIHPRALRGAMLYVSLQNRIPILHTENAAETVELLFAMAELVQGQPAREFSLHAKRRSPSAANTSRYLLETIPGIGPHLARVLLEQFGSLQAVFNATPAVLQEVPGIGRNKAERIRDVLQREYRQPFKK